MQIVILILYWSSIILIHNFDVWDVTIHRRTKCPMLMCCYFFHILPYLNIKHVGYHRCLAILIKVDYISCGDKMPAESGLSWICEGTLYIDKSVSNSWRSSSVVTFTRLTRCATLAVSSYDTDLYIYIYPILSAITSCYFVVNARSERYYIFESRVRKTHSDRLCSNTFVL